MNDPATTFTMLTVGVVAVLVLAAMFPTRLKRPRRLKLKRLDDFVLPDRVKK